jgi:anti-sigma factor RsiW
MRDDHVGESAELYALGLLDAAEIRAVDEHTRECEACAKRVGEAEETVLDLERTARPVPAPASLDRRMHFTRRGLDVRVWLAVAAALALGFSIGVAGLFRPAPPAREAATVAMVESHFNHAQFAGTGPPAKVIYARDRSWIYVIVAAGERYDVYAVRGGQARLVGSTQSNGATSEAFIAQPGALDAVELRSGSTVVETARVR